MIKYTKIFNFEKKLNKKYEIYISEIYFKFVLKYLKEHYFKFIYIKKSDEISYLFKFKIKTWLEFDAYENLIKKIELKLKKEREKWEIK